MVGFWIVAIDYMALADMKTKQELEQIEADDDVMNRVKEYMKEVREWKKNQKKKSYHSKSGLKR